MNSQNYFFDFVRKSDNSDSRFQESTIRIRVEVECQHHDEFATHSAKKFVNVALVSQIVLHILHPETFVERYFTPA